MIKSRWLITIDDVETEVYPSYSDDAYIDYDRTSGEYFFTESMSDALTFHRGDYDFIIDKPYDTYFDIKMQKDYGSGWVNKISGSFHITDTEIDEEGRLVVSPNYTNKSILVTDSKDKEFDFIELGVSKKRCIYFKRPVLQIYERFADTLTNLLPGVSWEQSVNTPVPWAFDLINDYKFGAYEGTIPSLDNRYKRFFTGEGDITPDVGGYYSYDDHIRYDGRYRMYEIGNTSVSDFPTHRPEGEPTDICNMAYESSPLHDFDDALSIWQDDNGRQYEFIGVVTDNLNDIDRLYWRALSSGNIPATGSMTHVSGATNTSTFSYVASDSLGPGKFVRRFGLIDLNPPSPLLPHYVYLTKSVIGNPSEDLGYNYYRFYSLSSDSETHLVYVDFYCRLLSNSDSLNGQNTQDIPSDDIVPPIANYTKVLPISFDNYRVSDEHNPNDGYLGRIYNDAANYAGEFYAPYIPDPALSIDRTYPINKTNWQDASFWFWFNDDLDSMFTEAQESVNLRHSYLLHEVISTLLREIDSDITFEPTIDHSIFLFSDVNPISNDPQPTLVVTPKSNVVNSGYSKPADTAKIKLGGIFDLLYKMYRLKYVVDDQNRLRFEHESFFDNGYSYGSENIGIDIRDLLESKTKDSWLNGSKVYSWNKSEMYEYLSYGWMDEVSKPFEGYDIQVKSDYVKKGLIEDMKINEFTSDIDFVMTQPQTVSKDGFMIFGVFENDSGVYEVPVLDVDLGENRTFSLQNGYLSMYYLHSNYHRYNMPDDEIRVNSTDTIALSISKTKQRDLTIGIIDDFNKNHLIVDDIGTGFIEKVSESVNNNTFKLKIKHGTV